MGHQALHELLPRGVYRAPYLKNGRRLLLAVNRFGNVVKRVQLLADTDELDVTSWLERLLDHIDPVPQLCLMADLPPAPPTVITPDDPRHPRALKRYHLQLVKAAARAMPPGLGH
jgi:hypothetical protein